MFINENSAKIMESNYDNYKEYYSFWTFACCFVYKYLQKSTKNVTIGVGIRGAVFISQGWPSFTQGWPMVPLAWIMKFYWCKNQIKDFKTKFVLVMLGDFFENSKKLMLRIYLPNPIA